MTKEPVLFDVKRAEFLHHPFYRDVISSLESPHIGAMGVKDGLSIVRFVGGAVRNALLGLPSKDVDLATTLFPQEVVSRLEARGFRVIPTGLSHGTVRVLDSKVGVVSENICTDEPSCEITTLRRDIKTDGRHARVAFTDDWQVDASRRDFTINALYADVAGKGYDYVGGIADLQAKRLRFIGSPGERIREDYLRILRLFRLRSQYPQLEPGEKDLLACTNGSAGIARLSGERIMSELLALLGGADPCGALRLMLRYKVLIIDGIGIDESRIRFLEQQLAFERDVDAEDAVRRFFFLIDTPLLQNSKRVVKNLINRLSLSTAIGNRLLSLCDHYAMTKNSKII